MCLQMLLVDFYRGAPDLVQFTQYWCPDTTMLDKIKVRQLMPDCMFILYICVWSVQ